MESYSQKIYDSWRELQDAKYGEMMRIIGKPLFSKIFSSLTLDIGAGDSQFLRFLRFNGIDANIVGMDVSKEMRRDVPFVIGDGDAPPFRNASFSSVVCIDTAHLLRTDNFKRVLKQGGFSLFATFFNAQNYEERKDALKGKLADFDILMEFEVHLREKEYVILARKK